MKTLSDVLSQLSFWFFVIGILLLLMRGMGPPGAKSINRKKFAEVRSEINDKLSMPEYAPSSKRWLLYAGKYLFAYFYYRADLILYFFIGGGLFLKFISAWIAS